jgi:hypothetical protein
MVVVEIGFGLAELLTRMGIPLDRVIFLTWMGMEQVKMIGAIFRPQDLGKCALM